MNGETKQRGGEQIGGGHFVFRRTEGGRITPNRCPFEHPSLESAQNEAQRLALKYPGTTFIVVSERAAVTASADR